MDQLLTSKEVAAKLATTQRTVLNLIYKRDLIAIRVGFQWRVAASELERFMRKGARRTKGGTP